MTHTSSWNDWFVFSFGMNFSLSFPLSVRFLRESPPSLGAPIHPTQPHKLHSPPQPCSWSCWCPWSLLVSIPCTQGHCACLAAITMALDMTLALISTPLSPPFPLPLSCVHDTHGCSPDTSALCLPSLLTLSSPEGSHSKLMAPVTLTSPSLTSSGP